jgi:hypothetical protein
VKARVANRGPPPTITVIVAETPWAPVSVNAHRPNVNRVNLLTCYEDLSREYQAIIAYVVYFQVLSGAEYMDIAAQLEIHAKQELDHALIISRQIDYLGKMPAVTQLPRSHPAM